MGISPSYLVLDGHLTAMELLGMFAGDLGPVVKGEFHTELCPLFQAEGLQAERTF